MSGLVQAARRVIMARETTFFQNVAQNAGLQTLASLTM